MLDTKALERAVEKQIIETVDSQVMAKLSSDEWLESIEQKIIEFTQSRLIGKFHNSSAVPEIVNVVKLGIEELFNSGAIPGIENFVNNESIKSAIDIAVENCIFSAIQNLNNDPTWQEKIEIVTKQAMVQRVVAQLSSIDIASLVNARVDENFKKFKKDLVENFTSTGIEDKATLCQLTIMDSDTVIENKLTAKSVEVVNELCVTDLIVKGNINTDSRGWKDLANSISEVTLNKLTLDWKETLTNQVADKIQDQGIEFSQVKLDGNYLVVGNQLSDAITETNIQKVGKLKNLQVKGETHLNDSLHVLKNRIGINTENPESTLSIWDEEVTIGIGKHRAHEAFIGTNRTQTLHIGVNKDPLITLDIQGITAVKKLRVGLHMIGHATTVPNWSGTRGDIIFNSNPTPDSAFAWVCLGAFKWKTLRAISE